MIKRADGKGEGRTFDGEKIAGAVFVNATSIGARVARHAPKHRISAIATAHNRDLGGIGYFVADRPSYGIGQVIVQIGAPFPRRGVEERFSKAGRAAHVHTQYGITAIGQPLMDRIETEAVAVVRA